MKRSFLFILLVSVTFSCLSQELFFTQIPWGGRLGDQLMMYIKGKWMAHKHGGSILLRGFKYDNQLVLGQKEKHSSQRAPHTLVSDVSVQLSKGLFAVSYWYKADAWDDGLEVSLWHDVWQHTEFLQELRELIAPSIELNLIYPPQDQISVALHVRKGGGFDWPLKSEGQAPGKDGSREIYADEAWPYKFPPDEYYIAQLIRLSEMFDDQPIYVHLFTDDQDPSRLITKYAQAVNKPNITFGYRQQGNAHDNNVLEDFFSIPLFDCLIRSKSNFPQIGQLIGNHKVVIYPKKVVWEGDIMHVSDVGTFVRN